MGALFKKEEVCIYRLDHFHSNIIKFSLSLSLSNLFLQPSNLIHLPPLLPPNPSRLFFLTAAHQVAPLQLACCIK